MSDMSIEEFGRQLVTTLDLDPVYVALARADLSREHMKRWLLAYWCFYHVGAASYISDKEGHEYWGAMLVAARNEEPAPTGERWPRASERRYFRGEKCVDAVRYMAGAWPEPAELVGYVTEPDTCGGIMKRVAELPMFGRWIGFKVADMTERVLRRPVSFTTASLLMFDAPKEAASMLYAERNDGANPGDVVEIGWSLDYLRTRLGELTAPPHHDRVLGLQELETVLCKWKSHRNGHYPVGKDSHEVRAALDEWSKHSATATRLSVVAP